MEPLRTVGGQHLRSVPRHRGLYLVAATITGLAVGARYKASAIKRNEQAQKASDDPNYYVSVDRSGGGV
ncbi:uncharacterized protein PG998_004154 [Apiospora kogelbergensis]|uniref:Uncharacterized protein n=1 Tax=Apiospora kogelbergensis TaxID=1337665 RepID=A0AAW0QUN0_9PEZI